MFFFVAFWLVLVVGFLVHVLIDRHRLRRTGGRVVELALLWLLVFGGAYGIFGGTGHIGPNSTQIAEEIGYAPSMFQWEVGWADIAIGVLGIMCVRWRDRWLTAAVVGLAVLYGGDAIGHVMDLADGNDAINNVLALPSDVVQVVVAVVLLLAYRRGLGRLPDLPKHGVLGGSA